MGARLLGGVGLSPRSRGQIQPPTLGGGEGRERRTGRGHGQHGRSETRGAASLLPPRHPPPCPEPPHVPSFPTGLMPVALCPQTPRLGCPWVLGAGSSESGDMGLGPRRQKLPWQCVARLAAKPASCPDVPTWGAAGGHPSPPSVPNGNVRVCLGSPASPTGSQQPGVCGALHPWVLLSRNRGRHATSNEEFRPRVSARAGAGRGQGPACPGSGRVRTQEGGSHFPAKPRSHLSCDSSSARASAKSRRAAQSGKSRPSALPRTGTKALWARQPGCPPGRPGLWVPRGLAAHSTLPHARAA